MKISRLYLQKCSKDRANIDKKKSVHFGNLSVTGGEISTLQFLQYCVGCAKVDIPKNKSLNIIPFAFLL